MTRRLALGLLAAVIGAAGCGGGHAPSLPIPTGPPPERPHHVLKMIWGPNTLPDGRSAFPLYRRLGVDVLEIQVP